MKKGAMREGMEDRQLGWRFAAIRITCRAVSRSYREAMGAD